jgi:hypothetical protein
MNLLARDHAEAIGMTDHDHYDLAMLDAVRTGEAPWWVRRHVKRCAACRETLAELQTLSSHLNTSVQAQVGEVPGYVDQAVLRVLRTRRLSPVAVAWRWRPLAGLGASVAAVLLAAGLWLWIRADRRATTPVTAWDVDGNGQRDILDAYMLARQVRAGQALPARWDFTGDGRVDERDVELVARDAVALQREGA